MGASERARWGIGTVPVVGTPVNLMYWIFTKTLPTAAGVGSSYLVSKHIVSPAMFKAVAWANTALGNPTTSSMVSKKFGEWSAYKTLRVLGFKMGEGQTVLRALPRSSLGGIHAMKKLGPLKHVRYHTGAGAMRWAPGPILRTLGWVGIAYGVHETLSKRRETGRSMYYVMDPRTDTTGGTSWWG